MIRIASQLRFLVDGLPKMHSSLLVRNCMRGKDVKIGIVKQFHRRTTAADCTAVIIQ